MRILRFKWIWKEWMCVKFWWNLRFLTKLFWICQEFGWTLWKVFWLFLLRFEWIRLNVSLKFVNWRKVQFLVSNCTIALDLISLWLRLDLNFVWNFENCNNFHQISLNFVNFRSNLLSTNEFCTKCGPITCWDVYSVWIPSLSEKHFYHLTK